MGKTVNELVWREPKFNQMSMLARMSYIYLSTSPNVTEHGFFEFPKEFGKRDLGVTKKDFDSAFLELINNEFIQYDEEVDIAFIPSVVEFSKIRNPNQMKAFMKSLEVLPKTFLWSKLKEILSKKYHKMSKIYLPVLENNELSIPPKKTLVENSTPSEDLFEVDTPDEKKEDENEEDAESEEEKQARLEAERARRERKRAEKKEMDEWFEKFYNAYPRREQRTPARQAYEKTVKKNKKIPQEHFVIAAQNYAEEVARKARGIDYIKLPATFLGPREYWKDYLPQVENEQPVLVEESTSTYDPSKPITDDNMPTNQDIINMFAELPG